MARYLIAWNGVGAGEVEARSPDIAGCLRYCSVGGLQGSPTVCAIDDPRAILFVHAAPMDLPPWPIIADTPDKWRAYEEACDAAIAAGPALAAVRKFDDVATHDPLAKAVQQNSAGGIVRALRDTK